MVAWHHVPMMRAWQVRETGDPSEVLDLSEIAVPIPKANEVLLEVESVGLNFPDGLQIRGGYQVKMAMPFIPGSEIAGTIVKLGTDVTGYKLGERVAWMGSGGLAEFVAAPTSGLFPIPDGMTFDQAVCLPYNYGTGVFALENRAKLKAGETMLVTAAAGGVGSAAVQLGKAIGANVIGLAGGPDKVATVYELGADAAFDYKEVNVVDAVRAATDGRGVDVCYEAVGGDTFDQVRRCMGWDGRLLIIGFTSGRIAQAPTNHLLLKNYSVVGVHWAAYLARSSDAPRQNWDRIVDLFNTGKIDPLISSVRPLDQAQQGLVDIASRRTVGKVVIKPNS